MNPFIELYQNPVAFFATLGYVLMLATLVVATAGAVYRNFWWLLIRWQNQRPQQWQYIPPAMWLARAALIPFILMVDAWAIGATIWLLS